MTNAGWTSRSYKTAAMTFAAVLALGQAAAWADAPSLVGEWNLDEGSGQVALDDGPFGLNGLLGASGAPDAADPPRIAGVTGGALHFDGTTYVQLPESPRLALQAMTVEAVVRAGGSPGAYRYILSRGGRGCFSGSYGLYTAPSGGIAFYVFDGARYVLSATARVSDVWDGQWHRVSATFDGRSLRLYVDGRAVGEPMAAPLAVDYATTSDRASIGAYVGSCDLPYAGDVDLVRIVDGALSPGAIADAAKGKPLAGDGSPSPSAPLPPPLLAGAPGTVIPSPIQAGSRAPACVIKLSRKRIGARRTTVVRASVGARRVTVVARRTSHGKPLAKARSNAAGVARLRIRAPRSGRVTISIDGRQACAPASLRVVGR